MVQNAGAHHIIEPSPPWELCLAHACRVPPLRRPDASGPAPWRTPHGTEMSQQHNPLAATGDRVSCRCCGGGGGWSGGATTPILLNGICRGRRRCGWVCNCICRVQKHRSGMHQKGAGGFLSFMVAEPATHPLTQWRRSEAFSTENNHFVNAV